MIGLLRRHPSIATQLTAWYAATAFVLVSASVGMQYRSLRRDLASEDDQLVRETATAVRQSLADSDRSLLDWGRGLAQTDGPSVRLLDVNCRTLDTRARGTLPPPDCRTAFTSELQLRSWRGPDGMEWRIGSTRVGASNNVLEVLLDRSTDVNVLARFRHQIYLVLAAALIAAIALGFLIARRGLSPIGRLARRVTRVDANSLDQRLHVDDAPAEVRELSGSFDAMLVRLQTAFSTLSSYSADMAHELRTPLHVLRQQTEVALNRDRTPQEYRDLLASNLEELDRLRRMTDDMLFLARAEDPRAAVRRERLVVREELQSVSEFMEAIAESRALSLTTDAPDDLTIEADRMLIRRALVNLVSNALAHTPAGGTIKLAGRRVNGSAVLSVEDSGTGIAPDAIPYVFERYYRSAETDHVRSQGAGLGLAIVQGIARLHGGFAVAENATERGTRIRLELPVIPTADRT